MARGILEGSMNEYELRILKEDRTPALTIWSVHLNADAAINAARKASKGAPFEVWRDDECVYCSADRAPLHFPQRRSA
jgi:hypothetical protein